MSESSPVRVDRGVGLGPLLGRRRHAGGFAKPLAVQEIVNWKTVGATAVSNEGQWFAYRMAPDEGDAQVVVTRTKRTGDAKDLQFDIGEIPTAGPGGRGRGGGEAAGGSATLDFSEDSKWVAFTTYPSRREAQRLRRLRRQVQSGVTIVNLTTAEKRDYPRIRRFAFSGDASTWIALLRQPPQTTANTGAGQGEGRGAGSGQGGGAAAAERRAARISSSASSRPARN